MRRGHRLHSIHGGDDLEVSRFLRETTGLAPHGSVESREEKEFIDFIRYGDVAKIRGVAEDVLLSLSVSQNASYVRKCVKEAIGTRNLELIRSVLEVLCHANPKAFEVGELFLHETLNNGAPDLVLAILNFWVAIHAGVAPSSLEIIQNAVYFASNKKLKDTKTLNLIEQTIYCATVDKNTEILEEVLQWHEQNVDIVGQSVKLNADCMIHAALEDDRERLAVLYSFGYRLGNETDRRITKDYLKRIKLFKARASPVYKSVVFENSKDIYKDDPLKKCFEYARQARINADKIQDFTKEYMDIAKNCEEFAKGLLDRCTTKHEVQMLLQTKSYRGHMDANFNIAILDGHKNFVAHEKFQQLLHKKWGQRDRLKFSEMTPSYNLFWSEKSTLEKLAHMFKQIIVFLFLPVVYVISELLGDDRIMRCQPFGWFLLQGQIPVNRFLYWEMSKLLFYFVVLMTLINGVEISYWDGLAVIWITSYLLENFRTIHRLYRFGGSCDTQRIFKRWLTFRNIYILATDVVFFAALILRGVAFLQNQCRKGCPYEGNEVAFVASAIWSIAALLTFLRSIQGGLMWRQTGPVIISISYMILDVLVFLFIFVIVYLSFTVSMVYVYDVYSSDRTRYFNSHKWAFKLFFWAMIRTGNPQYADIYQMNDTNKFQFNSSCLRRVIDSTSTTASESFLPASEVEACAVGGQWSMDREDRIEEGVSYVVGNTLWAFYQFTVVIVLLSILRARMVNTYHRVFKEADVQWKYFRASIWWKYLDEDSFLPPPFTALYFFKKGMCFIIKHMKRCFKMRQEIHMESYEMKRTRELEERLEVDKREFERRYRNLMLMLISQPLKTGS